MKIGPSEKSSVYTSVTESGTPTARPARASGPSGAASGTATTLSNVATQMQALGMQAAGGDFDAGRVEAIKQAIADGAFHVDADRVADKLIADVRAMIGQ